MEGQSADASLSVVDPATSCEALDALLEAAGHAKAGRRITSAKQRP